MALRVLLADDHGAVRQGLRALLEREGLDVVEAADGRTAVELTLKLRPDVVVVDMAMPGLNGVDAAREITRASPQTGIILLTGLPDARLALDALRAGVRGFVMKTQGCEDLFEAIHQVWEGGLYLSPGASRAVVDACTAADNELRRDRLSPREREVVCLVAEGQSTKQIAQRLKISTKTAEFHRGRIMGKLKIHNTAGLVRYAIREGMVTP
jgi:DNA-binding NarL/FixJ family response regulator